MFGFEISLPTNRSNATISNVTVANNNTGKCWPGDRDGAGIAAYTAAATGDGSSIGTVTIQNNTITGNEGDGIRISAQSGPITVYANRIHGNDEYGVQVLDDASVANNTALKLHYNLIYLK